MKRWETIMLTASGVIRSRATVIMFGRLANSRDAFMKRRFPPTMATHCVRGQSLAAKSGARRIGARAS